MDLHRFPCLPGNADTNLHRPVFSVPFTVHLLDAERPRRVGREKLIEHNVAISLFIEQSESATHRITRKVAVDVMSGKSADRKKSQRRDAALPRLFV
jgi:hypothetical protein